MFDLFGVRPTVQCSQPWRVTQSLHVVRYREGGEEEVCDLRSGIDSAKIRVDFNVTRWKGHPG